MNPNLLYSELNKWLVEFVEKPNDLLQGWPVCPYSKQARIADSIEIIFSQISELTQSVLRSIVLLEKKEVVIIMFNHNDITVKELDDYIDTANKDLMPIDYVLLEDHPDKPEIVNGLTLNFKKCGLIIAQRLSKLNKASDTLKEKGYYNVWSVDDLKQVVDWRK